MRKSCGVGPDVRVLRRERAEGVCIYIRAGSNIEINGGQLTGKSGQIAMIKLTSVRIALLGFAGIGAR